MKLRNARPLLDSVVGLLELQQGPARGMDLARALEPQAAAKQLHVIANEIRRLATTGEGRRKIVRVARGVYDLRGRSKRGNAVAPAPLDVPQATREAARFGPAIDVFACTAPVPPIKPPLPKLPAEHWAALMASAKLAGEAARALGLPIEVARQAVATFAVMAYEVGR